MVLAIVHQPGENLSAQLDWMPMPPVGKAVFTLALHSLEQSVDSRPMHRDTAVNLHLRG